MSSTMQDANVHAGAGTNGGDAPPPRPNVSAFRLIATLGVAGALAGGSSSPSSSGRSPASCTTRRRPSPRR
jgi:hypothetical protein